MVGLEDFFAFAEVYGSVDGDGIYQAKFDLSRNGSIGLEDFFIFAESFGNGSWYIIAATRDLYSISRASRVKWPGSIFVFFSRELY